MALPWKVQNLEDVQMVLDGLTSQLEDSRSNIPTLETSLPPGPYPGQTVDWLVDAVSGVIWTMVWHEGLQKWLFKGGAPLRVHSLASQTVTALANDVAPLSAPMAGSYVFDTWIQAISNAANGYCGHTLNVSGVNGSGTYSVSSAAGLTAQAGQTGEPRVVSAANLAVVLQHSPGGGATSCNVVGRSIKMTPIALG